MLPVFRTVALGVTLGLAGLVVDAVPASAAVDTGADEIALVGMINAERAAAGVPPLSIDGRLFDSARSWSSTQASLGDLSHDQSFFGANRPSGARAVAENVAYNVSAEAAHARLMASPAHRANILNPEFTAVGVGEVVAPDGRVFVTQRFARMDGSAGAKAAPKAAKSVKAKAPKARQGRTAAGRRR